MLHHLSLGVTNLSRSGIFYDAALAPLDYVRVWADDTAIGYGPVGGGDKFAIKLQTNNINIPGESFHIAFTAHSHASVDTFYKDALTHGGKDNGGSGFHPEYGEHYYAAFVFDPDGYRIEAVINKKVEQDAAANP